MDFCEFCLAFHRGGHTAIINGYKSKPDIGEYIIRLCLKEDNIDGWNEIPDESGREKWLQPGISNSPKTKLWNYAIKDFNEKVVIEKLKKDIIDSKINDIASYFSLKFYEDVEIDKTTLCTALAKLLHAIAIGYGKTNYTLSSFYPNSIGYSQFPVYKKRCMEKYSKVLTMASPEEKLFDEIFVPSTISNRPDIGNKRQKLKGRVFFEDASLEDLAPEYKKAILIGNGGMGKSLMLQHLFLDSIKKIDSTGFLPVIVEIRNFTTKDDLLEEIIETYSQYDESLNDEIIKALLNSGKCQILLDGLDEIDPGDIKDFYKKLIKITNQYPDSQYLIASRECANARMIREFSRLFLLSFDINQSNELINKIYKDEPKEYKKELSDYLQKEFMKKHSAFVKNPMLLTYTIKNYPLRDTFKEKHIFFKKAYQTILTGHDDYKDAYDRIFRSVINPEDFTTVFREFCTITYSNGESIFDPTKFTGYYNKLTSINNLHDSEMMTEKNFLHDACATACMMYEEELNLFYVDEGFQEYLFAESNYIEDEEYAIEISKKMWNLDATKFSGTDAFQMLYAMSHDKLELCYFLPYLNKIFTSSNDDDNFWNFLIKGFHELQAVYMDSEKVIAYKNKNKTELWLQPISNTPYDIILTSMLDILKIKSNYEILTNLDELLSDFTIDRYITTSISFDGEKEITSFVMTSDDKNNEIYGHTYSIKTNEINKNSETYSKLFKLLKVNDIYKTFLRLKEYKNELQVRKDSL